MEREITSQIKAIAYQRKIEKRTFYFIDIEMEYDTLFSLCVNHDYSESELRDLLTLALRKHYQDPSLPSDRFSDPFAQNGARQKDVKITLENRWGAARVDANWETPYFVVVYHDGAHPEKLQETFYTDRLGPLFELRKADAFARKRAVGPYQIFLSDEKHPVDPEFLAFATQI
jgi:hypothetical protein